VTSISEGLGLTFRSNPLVSTGTIGINPDVVAQKNAANTFIGTQTFRTGDSMALGLVVQGASGQTEAIQQWRDASGNSWPTQELRSLRVLLVKG
jgi:hypothetical protein